MPFCVPASIPARIAGSKMRQGRSNLPGAGGADTRPVGGRRRHDRRWSWRSGGSPFCGSPAARVRSIPASSRCGPENTSSRSPSASRSACSRTARSPRSPRSITGGWWGATECANIQALLLCCVPSGTAPQSWRPSSAIEGLSFIPVGPRLHRAAQRADPGPPPSITALLDFLPLGR
jgi:hypothetical protein